MPEATSVLVVDDERDLCDVLAWRMRRKGWHVDTLAEGTRVLEFAARRPYQVFVLDVMMPGIKGLELCRLLREDRRSRGAGILVCSAMGDALDRADVLEAGADDYLPKPLDLEAFERRVGLLARRAQAPRSAWHHPRFSLDLDQGLLLLDGRALPLKAGELGLFKALALLPKGRWTPMDRLASALWGLDVKMAPAEMARTLASLSAKTGLPGSGQPPVVEYHPERGVQFHCD